MHTGYHPSQRRDIDHLLRRAVPLSLTATFSGADAARGRRPEAAADMRIPGGVVRVGGGSGIHAAREVGGAEAQSRRVVWGIGIGVWMLEWILPQHALELYMQRIRSTN